MFHLVSSLDLCRFPFEQRAQLAKNPLGKKLFELMAEKQSNLAVAADVPTAEAMLRLADQADLTSSSLVHYTAHPITTSTEDSLLP